MNKLSRNIKGCLALLMIMFLLLAGYFCYALFFYGDRWFSNTYNNRVRMNSEQPRIIPGDIFDRNKTLLATTKKGKYKNSKTGKVLNGYYRKYNADGQYAAHVVGFHNEYGRAGAEAFHIRYLMGYNNNIFERIYQKAFMPYERGNDIILTIDFRLQRYISSLMGGRKGSVVLINPKTGEILAMVSQPSFNPNDMSTVKGDNLVDRATQGMYPPGSVFKIITGTSSLENIEGITERTFNCEGTMKIGEETVSCYDKKAHGKLDLNQAMTVSCNTTFAQIGVELGREALLKTGQKFGFNREFLFSDLKVSKSTFPLDSNVSKDQLAWSSIGQGKDLVTPMHMALVAASVANDGVMMEPKLLYKVLGRNDRVQKTLQPKVYSKPLTPENAAVIKSMMVNVVENGTGRSAKVKGLKVAGKTGTAEVKATKESKISPHAWFVGFAPADDPTLAISVVIENSGTGGGQAAPLAGKILKKARELGY